jgi:ferredoxin-NADP reductase
MIKLFRIIDDSINKETMYRMVLYGVGGMVIISLLCSLLGFINFSALSIFLSLLILVVICFVANRLLAIVSDAQTNTESWLITALILTLILPPVQTLMGAAFVALAGLIAMASKYIITFRHRHIFNPAAFAAIILTLTGWLPAIWWVGTPLLVIFSSTFGIVLLRKLRRYSFFFVFAAVTMLTALLVGISDSQQVPGILSGLLVSSPMIFFGTIMLTEPETMPSGRIKKLLYAGIVGIIFSSQLHFGSFYTTPEVALIIGNLLAFLLTNGHYKQKVRFVKKVPVGSHINEYVFATSRPIIFTPGQYMEWTLTFHKTDKRGDRRSFSMSSAPSNNEIRFATKLAEKSSRFKSELELLKPGDVITAGQLNGEFTLPKQKHQKVAGIAGGIGITPFVSMIRYMIENNEHRDFVLFYLIANEKEYAYQDVWKQATSLGVKVIPVVTSPDTISSWKGLKGRLTPELIQQQLPDYKDRQFYLSGPNGLVQFFRSTLRRLSLQRQAIHTDYFSGY